LVQRGPGVVGACLVWATGMLRNWPVPVDDADAEEEAGGAERGHPPLGHARRRRLVRPQRRRRHHGARLRLATSDASFEWGESERASEREREGPCARVRVVRG